MKAKIEVKKVTSLNSMDLSDLADATIATMNETLGFNVGTSNINSIERSKISFYWEGVLLVPERLLFVAKLDGVIAGSVQLVLPSPSNQTSAFSANIDNHFVAPWARGHGLSNLLMEHAEAEAKKHGISILKLSVRETREAAIKVFEKRGFVQWGKLPKYELDQGKIVAGKFYYKEL